MSIYWIDQRLSNIEDLFVMPQLESVKLTLPLPELHMADSSLSVLTHHVLEIDFYPQLFHMLCAV